MGDKGERGGNTSLRLDGGQSRVKKCGRWKLGETLSVKELIGWIVERDKVLYDAGGRDRDGLTG
jgi:hypothetical protein